jgi:hypothetical protein
MKKKLGTTTIILILVIIFSPQSSGAKTECKVNMPSIDQNYTGGCRNGLAHGKGIAVGVDIYEGRFRNGLPHGFGKYIWENGDTYEGRWRNGMKHGRGVLITKSDDGDIISRGTWRNDEFVGERKIAPYSLGNILNLKKHSIRKTGDENMILVTLYQNNRIIPPPRSFLFQIDTGSSIQLGQSTGYENVIFPASIRISYVIDGIIRVQYNAVINAPGTWEIRLYN